MSATTLPPATRRERIAIWVWCIAGLLGVVLVLLCTLFLAIPAEAAPPTSQPQTAGPLEILGTSFEHYEDQTFTAGPGGYALKIQRRADGFGGNHARFVNCFFEGPSLLEASEGCSFTACIFRVTSGTTPAIRICNGPPKPLGYTCQTGDFISCQFIQHGGGPAIEIESTAYVTNWNFLGGQVACGGTGTAAITLNTNTNWIKCITFQGVRVEAHLYQVGVEITGTAVPMGLAFRDFMVQPQGSFLRSKPPIYRSVFSNIECYASDRTRQYYAIDAALTNCDVKLLGAVGYVGDVRP